MSGRGAFGVFMLVVIVFHAIGMYSLMQKAIDFVPDEDDIDLDHLEL